MDANNRKSPYWLICAIFLLAVGSHASASGIDPEKVRDDSRLERLVSVSAASLPLSQVLDTLSRQSGVTLEIDPKDRASGYHLLIECKEVTLASVLDCLYSLLSARGAEWAWVRTGRSPSFAYTFAETYAAKHRADNYHRIVQNMLRDYVATLREMVDMTSAERLRHRKMLERALYIDDDAQLASFFESEAFWNHARFFFRALSPEQQVQVLNSSSASLNLSALPREIYNIYHEDYVRRDYRTRLEDGTSVPTPEPASVTLFSTKPSVSSLSPMIHITDSSGAISFMGTGHLDVGVHFALKRATMLPGDSQIDPLCNRVIASVTDPPEVLKTQKQRGQDVEEIAGQLSAAAATRLRESTARNKYQEPYYLHKVAVGASVPLMAILPNGGQNAFTDPAGKDVGSVTRQLEGRGYRYRFCKWRHGILLVNYPHWFTSQEPVISAALLAGLHRDPTGTYGVKELAELVGRINGEQTHWFGWRYGIEGLDEARPYLLLAARKPTILDANGSSVVGDLLDYAATLMGVLVNPDDRSSRALVLRLRTEVKAPNVNSMLLERYDNKLKVWRTLNTFRLTYVRPVDGFEVPH